MNILLSFASNKTEFIQYFKQALGNTGKVYACDCTLNYSLTQADGYLITPKVFNDSYISELTDFCKKKDISVIIPLSGVDLLVLSKNKNKLQDLGISAIVSDESIIDVCVDKWEMYLFLNSIGIKQPKTYIDLEAVKRDIESGTLSFPLFLKPRLFAEKTKEIDVDNIEELDLFYHKLQQKICLQKEDNNIIIIENIPGDRYGLFLFNDLQGNFITTAALRKLRVPDYYTKLAQVVDIHLFEDVVKLISAKLKHIAFLEIELYLTESGDIIFSEIYACFGNSYPFLHIAGANFPKQIVDWLNKLPVSSNNLSYENGVMGERKVTLKIIDIA